MKIRDMFKKDINRDINGVIKVSQDDAQSLEQELSEYIITKELRRHFSTSSTTIPQPSIHRPIKSACGSLASSAVVNPTS